LPDPDLGLALHATVQHDPDVLPADADALLAWLDRRIARPKWPRSFDFVTIPIRDEAGKLRRSAWRERRMAAFNQHSGGASQV
jgi:bile acid-coenzyme A ligase